MFPAKKQPPQWLEQITFWLLLLTVVVVPLIFQINLVNAFILPKEYAIAGGVALILILWAARVLTRRTLGYHSTPLTAILIVLLLVVLIVTFFAPSLLVAFVGNHAYFSQNAIIFISGIGLYFFLVEYVTTRVRWTVLLDIFIATGGLTVVFFLLRVWGGSHLAALWPNIWNTLDEGNANFAVWVVVVFLLAAGQLFSKESRSWRVVLYGVTALLALVAAVLLSFQTAWWILLIGLFGLLVFSAVSFKNIRGWMFSLSVLLTTACLAFIFFGTPVSWRAVLPPEIYLNQHASLIIAERELGAGVKNFLIGTGMGTFPVSFSQFRPADFNSDSLLWSVRFTRPASSLLALATEGGALLVISFLALVVLTIIWVMKIWRAARQSEESRAVEFLRHPISSVSIFAVAWPWFVLTVATGLVYFTASLWWLWWLLLGVTAALLTVAADKEPVEKKFGEQTPERNLVISFIFIAAAIGILFLIIEGVRYYEAELSYHTALVSHSLPAAENNLEQAINYSGSVADYHAVLAQAFRLDALLSAQTSTPDLQHINTLVSNSIEQAKIATTMDPQLVTMWENLATMYETTANLLPNAYTWAIGSLKQALTLDPTDPSIMLRLGNDYVANKQYNEAEQQYKAAVGIKVDYVDAYVALAGVYEQLGQLDDAVATYVKMPAAGENNATILFDYGRVLYNRNKAGDRDLAEKIWLSLIAQDPNNANALYSLGLLYQSRGNTSLALQYFKKVQALNPDNKDLQEKIDFLLGRSVPIAPVTSTAH